jgi:hypothetical protein
MEEDGDEAISNAMIQRMESELFMRPSVADSPKVKESLVIERGTSEEGMDSNNYYYFDGVDYSQQLQQTGLSPGLVALDQWAIANGDGDDAKSALADSVALDSLRAVPSPGKKKGTPGLKKKKTVMV